MGRLRLGGIIQDRSGHRKEVEEREDEVGSAQKGSTRDLTTAVGRAGSCQPYISSCARRTIYPHILLNRGPVG